MKSRHLPFGFFALLGITLLTGCVSQFSKKEITPPSLIAVNKHPGTVLVSATGGGQIHAMAFNVENETLQQAIADSITQSGLFSRAVVVGNADYQLEVLLVVLKQPNDGFTMHGAARTIWKLTRLQDHKQVFQDEIVTEDRETVADHFVGGTRARAAVSGSVRKNIQEGIARIAKTEF